MRVASSRHKDAVMAAGEIRDSFAGITPQHLIIFFSRKYNAEQLALGFATCFPSVPLTGCSTAGEITPSGMSDDGVVAIAFPKEGFRVLSQTIENLSVTSIDQASTAARQLKSKLNLPPKARSCDNVFGILLVDGLLNVEEQVAAAINWALGDIQLIGGSAGDNLVFNDTVLIANNRVLRNAAILLLAQTDIPFEVFKTQNFDPTETKLVVTAADTEKRIVYELNAEPAGKEYAEAIGLMASDLGPLSFASYPLVVRVGGDYHCRSIRNLNEDGSLSFFCAIDEGLVFTVARPNDILESTRRSLQHLRNRLSGLDMIIGFECILRRLDAENRQVNRALTQIYRDYGVVGFQTYGEQYNAMHLNQTLTGIAFGSAAPTSSSDFDGPSSIKSERKGK